MNPITHMLVGWVALESRLAKTRDKALVCLAGLAPDLDGLGIVVDFVTRNTGAADTNYYQDFHRLLGHGLPAALVISAVAAAWAHSKLRVAALAFLAVHLHFLCDLAGSRGATVEDLWPIYYLEPLSSSVLLSWQYQWQLVGWQNMVISMALMFVAFARATVSGYSPVIIFNSAADAVFVSVLRKWKAQLSSFGRH